MSSVASDYREMSNILTVSLRFFERHIRQQPRSKQNIVRFVQHVAKKDVAVRDSILQEEKENKSGSYELLKSFLDDVKSYLEVDCSDDDSPRLKDHLNAWVELQQLNM